MSHVLILMESLDSAQQKLLQRLCEENGLTAETAPLQAKSALERVVRRLPDLVLIDLIQAPAAECLAVQRLFQNEPDFRNIPLLYQLPKGTENKLDLLQGPSDFILKPYEPSEWVNRLRLMLWRYRRISGRETIQHGSLLIDLERYEVSVTGQRIDLTFKEYELLKFLATNAGKVFTRDSLLNKVWGYEYYGGTRTVDVHVRRLRSKLEDATHQFIETIRGVGYKFLSENGLSAPPPSRKQDRLKIRNPLKRKKK